LFVHPLSAVELHGEPVEPSVVQWTAFAPLPCLGHESVPHSPLPPGQVTSHLQAFEQSIVPHAPDAPHVTLHVEPLAHEMLGHALAVLHVNVQSQPVGHVSGALHECVASHVTSQVFSASSQLVQSAGQLWTMQ
jgi:hypothetical protein